MTRRVRRERRRTRLIPLAVTPALLLLVAASACTDPDDAGCGGTVVETQDDKTLVIEGDPWSGYAPFRDESLLDDLGYLPFYVDQPCQAQRAADITSGRADIALTTLDQYILHEPEGTIVGVIDQSVGADALVLNTRLHPYLDTLEDLPFMISQYALDGRKPVIAYTGNSPSEMLLNELSNSFEELRLDNFELVSVDSSATALTYLDNEDAQLAVLWEPDTRKAIDGGYKVALSSKDVPDSIVDVIVASDKLIESDPNAVQAVVQAFYSRMDSYLGEPGLSRLTDLIATDGEPDLDQAAATAVIQGIKLYDSREASAFLSDDEFPLDQPQIEQSIDAIGTLLALIHPDVDPDRAKVDGHFVKELLP